MEDDSGFVGEALFDEIGDEGFELAAVGGGIEAGDAVTGIGGVADHEYLIFVPGGAPEPEVWIADFGWFGPRFAVFGEPCHGVVRNRSLAVAFAAGGGGGEHQFAFGIVSNFGVAEIEIGQREMGDRLPFLAVAAGENADGTIGGDVAAAFAEKAEPLIFVPDQVREGAMRSGIPDARAFDGEQRESGE